MYTNITEESDSRKERLGGRKELLHTHKTHMQGGAKK